MNDDPKTKEDRPGLNESLREKNDTSRDTSRRTPSPADSASVQHEEGRAWVWIWAVAGIIGVLVLIYLFFW